MFLNFHEIIRLSCSRGVSVFSAGKLGLFYPHEDLIGSDPEVCSVVVWVSSKSGSALSSQECPLPLRAAGLLQSGCSQVSQQPPHGCRQGRLVGKWLTSCFWWGLQRWTWWHFPLWVSGAAGLPLRLTQNAVFQCFCELKGISLQASLLFLMCPGLNIQLPFLQLHSFLWLKQCVRNVKKYELCCGLWSSARRASCYFRSWI